MQPYQLSSGDVIADRRADYAKMLAEGGEPASAAELMEQALERAPNWAAGWFRLGEYREKAGAVETAIAALHKVVELDPEGLFGARLKLARMGDIDMPDHPPSRYIERLFDDYAERFDTALVKRLAYSVPQKLVALVPPSAGPRGRYRHAIDLGCGTGLFGAEIRERVGYLEGYDLSTNMLAKAAEKTLYDYLGQADLSLAPQDSGVFVDGFGPARADFVSIVDVLMYIGSLDSVFALVASLLVPRGIFAFSVEDAFGAEGFHLALSLRYAHSQTYIMAMLVEYGFTLQQTEKTTIRMDAGKPVLGILFLAEKTA